MRKWWLTKPLYGQIMGLGGVLRPELQSLEVAYGGTRMIIPLSSVHYLELDD